MSLDVKSDKTNIPRYYKVDFLHWQLLLPLGFKGVEQITNHHLIISNTEASVCIILW